MIFTVARFLRVEGLHASCWFWVVLERHFMSYFLKWLSSMASVSPHSVAICVHPCSLVTGSSRLKFLPLLIVILKPLLVWVISIGLSWYFFILKCHLLFVVINQTIVRTLINSLLLALFLHSYGFIHWKRHLSIPGGIHGTRLFAISLKPSSRVWIQQSAIIRQTWSINLLLILDGWHLHISICAFEPQVIVIAHYLMLRSSVIAQLPSGGRNILLHVHLLATIPLLQRALLLFLGRRRPIAIVLEGKLRHQLFLISQSFP